MLLQYYPILAAGLVAALFYLLSRTSNRHSTDRLLYGAGMHAPGRRRHLPNHLPAGVLYPSRHGHHATRLAGTRKYLQGCCFLLCFAERLRTAPYFFYKVTAETVKNFVLAAIYPCRYPAHPLTYCFFPGGDLYCSYHCGLYEILKFMFRKVGILNLITIFWPC